MSAAVVSGAVALLLQERPELTAQDVKAVLTSTTSIMAEGPLASGAGSLDVFAASQLVAALADNPALLKGGRAAGRRLSVRSESGTDTIEFEWVLQPAGSSSDSANAGDERLASDGSVFEVVPGPAIVGVLFDDLSDAFIGQYDD
jgi:hypothetical protein